MNFAHTLKFLLKLSGIKLKVLAKEVGYDTSYLSRFANDKMLPKQSQIKQLSHDLAVCFNEALALAENYDDLRGLTSEKIDYQNGVDQITTLLLEGYTQSITKWDQVTAFSKENIPILLYYQYDVIHIIQDYLHQLPCHKVHDVYLYLPESMIEDLLREPRANIRYHCAAWNSTIWFQSLFTLNTTFYRCHGQSQHYLYVPDYFYLGLNYFPKTQKIVFFQLFGQDKLSELNSIIHNDFSIANRELVISEPLENSIEQTFYLALSEPLILVNGLHYFRELFQQSKWQTRLKQGEVLYVEHEGSLVEQLESLLEICLSLNISVRLDKISVEFLCLSSEQGFYLQDGEFKQIPIDVCPVLYEQVKQYLMTKKVYQSHELSVLKQYHLEG